MPRMIPPWTFIEEDGVGVVKVGDATYQVDTTRPPAFFLPDYLESRLPSDWLESQRSLQESEQHLLMRWLASYRRFLARFDHLPDRERFREILDADTIALLIAAFDMLFLDKERRLQETIIRRLTANISFQGALYETSVAAIMIRAGFDIAFEDESDSSRKHPEFVATHRQTGIKVAVEAKSIHRQGVLGFDGGKPPPTVKSGSAHKIAAEIMGQVQRALPKADDLPFYVFVDLNLPPRVAERFLPETRPEFEYILPKVDHGINKHGIVLGKRLNLLVAMNRPMHLGDERHSGGDTLSLVTSPKPPERCRYPEGAQHIEEVKAAVRNYGTVRVA